MSTMNRVCEQCERRFWQGRGRPAKRCPECREGERYGAEHRRLRAQTVALAVGKACARCHQPMLAGQAVQLDHDDQDPSRYLGWSHASCNARAGAVNGNRARARAYRQAMGLPEPPQEPPRPPSPTGRRW